RVAAEVGATISKAQSEILKAEWTRRLAQRLDVDEQSLLAQLRRSPPSAEARRRAPALILPAEGGPKGFGRNDGELLRALFRRPELTLAPGEISEDDLEG